MRKCVKIISILVILTLLLSSCSSNTVDISALFSKGAVFEITDKIPGDIILNTVFFGNTAVILSQELLDSDDENPAAQYYLSKFDGKRAKISMAVNITDGLIDEPYLLDRNGDGNIVLVGYESDADSEMSVAYSFENLEPVGEKEEYTPSLPQTECEDNAFGIDFATGETISSYEYTDIPNQPIRVFALRNNPDAILFTNDLSFCVYSSYENIAAGLEDRQIADGNGESVVVYDFENAVLVNRFAFEKPENENASKCINSLYLGEKYVIIHEEEQTILTDENNVSTDEYTTRYYVWYYRTGAVNEPFKCEKRTVDELSALNGIICEQIKNETGINVYVNSDKYDFYSEDEDYYLYRDAKPLEVNILLTRIKAFLGYLPEGFARDMYEGLEVFEYGGFDIFIGSSIKGIASAYASSFMNNLTIVFGTAASDFRTVAHEFMHIMDTRIEDYLGVDTSFYELWCKYNPDSFEYVGLENEDSYYESEEYDNWFVSAYSTATDAEDRAEIFSYLFEDSFSDSPVPDWYNEKEPLREKADFLLKMIREAYPSLKNVRTAQWEQIPEAYKKQATSP